MAVAEWKPQLSLLSELSNVLSPFPYPPIGWELIGDALQLAPAPIGRLTVLPTGFTWRWISVIGLFWMWRKDHPITFKGVSFCWCFLWALRQMDARNKSNGIVKNTSYLVCVCVYFTVISGGKKTFTMNQCEHNLLFFKLALNKVYPL